MKYKPCVIKWIDITTLNGWVTQDEADDFITNDKENICFQAGFLYEQDEKQIVVLNSYFTENDLIGDVTKIPKGCILDIKIYDK